MNETELKQRTKQFALRALKLLAALPHSREGRVLGGQLARSATSVGANYRAACRGRSKAEFIAKLERRGRENGFRLHRLWRAAKRGWSLRLRGRTLVFSYWHAFSLVLPCPPNKANARVLSFRPV